jgi:hypothetical protein
MSELVWTREKPRDVGWYWLREERENGQYVQDEIVEVQNNFSSYYIVKWASGRREEKRNVSGLWAGPIAPPKEAR